MLDPKLLRDQLTETAQQLAKRGFVLDTEKLAALEAQRKTLQTQTQELQSQRNSLAKQIGQRKGKGESVDDLLKTAETANQSLITKEAELATLQQQLQSY